MRTVHIFARYFTLLLACLTPTLSQAENSQTFGDYVVHYNAFRSDTLTPEIAQAYQLTRRNNRAVVNITVQKKAADGKTIAVKAKVSGFASNLNSQVKNLEFREIYDADAIYYIAETQVSNEETLRFEITASPEGANINGKIKFSQQFFTD